MVTQADSIIENKICEICHLVSVAYDRIRQSETSSQKNKKVTLVTFLPFMFFHDNVASESPKKNAYASRLRTFLDNYLYLDEPMKAIYLMFPVSPATLIKHFEEETGQTIVQYRNDKRMEYASLLLRDYKITVAAVANRVGISNPSHFAKEFKKKFGISPKDFAKRHTTPQ